VHPTVSPEQRAPRAGTAPNSITGSGRRAFQRGRCRGVTATGSAAPQKQSPFRQTGPSNRQARPPKGDGVREESPRGSRPACARILPSSASAQFRNDSVVGPHRLGEVASNGLSPVAGGESNPKPAGSGVCRSEAGRGRAPEERLNKSRSPCCPSSASGSPRRAGVSWVRAIPFAVAANRQFMCFLSGAVFESLGSDSQLSPEVPSKAGSRRPLADQLARNRFASKGTCFFHRW
jgi:hypothetical protein